MLYHYDEETIIDSKTKELFTIDSNGEIISTGKIAPAIPMGASIRSPKQQAQSRRYYEERDRQRTDSALSIISSMKKTHKEELTEQEAKLKKDFFKEKSKNKKPSFCWVDCENKSKLFDDLSFAAAVRLIVLATYVDYKGRLMKTERTPMTIKDLGDVLNLKKAGTYDLLKELKPYIDISPDGLFLNKESGITRGYLPRNQYNHYQKIYRNTIQKLYAETDSRKHKQLGYVFQLLPYINLEFNAFCTDPFEQDFSKLELLTMKDFCNLIGYDVSKAARLKRELSQLQFVHDGHLEYLLIYLSADGITQNDMIMVNPNIIYNGNCFDEVYTYGKFCQVRPKKKKEPRHFVDKSKTGNSSSKNPNN